MSFCNPILVVIRRFCISIQGADRYSAESAKRPHCKVPCKTWGLFEVSKESTFTCCIDAFHFSTTNPGRCSSMDRKVVLGLAPFRHSALREDKAWPMLCVGTKEKSSQRILQQIYDLAQEQIWWSFFQQKREESLQMFWWTVGCLCWGGKSMLARAIAAETGAFVLRIAPDFGGNFSGRRCWL